MTKPFKAATLILLLIACFNAGAQTDALNYPAARMDSTTDTYFGTVVHDPYRWLEKDTLAASKEWLNDEAMYSESYLKKVRNRYSLQDQMKVNSYYTFGTIRKSGIYYFDLIRATTDSKPCLFIKREIDDEGRKIVDPDNYKNGRKEIVGIKRFKVSDDNKFLAFSLSYNGSDWQEIHVTSLYPFHEQDDEIKGVKFNDVEWYRNGFFYLRYPMNGNIFQDKTIHPSIWYHTLGTPQENDRLVYEDAKFSDPFIFFDKVTDVKNSYLVIKHSNPDINKVLAISLDSNFALWKTDTIIISRQKADYDVIGLYNDKFLVKTTLNSPNGRLVLFDKDKKNTAAEFVPEHIDVLHKASIIGDKIVCIYLKDVDYESVTFNKSGEVMNMLTYPPGSSVEGFDGNSGSPITTFYQYSFLHPPIVYQFNTITLERSLVKKTQITYDISDFETEKVYYYSKDSTKIPMILAHKKGIKKNAKNPTLLYGYGGYGIVTTPFYDRGFISFMQNGGIVAIPCLRGGGEYGEKWHEGGDLLNKENVFDDFIAAAEFLCKENYTTNKMLALMGGSNGGLLVAAVLNKRPDICKVAVAINGIYDMLRYQEFTIGSAWEREFGSSKDFLQFSNLYHYSPLHNIKDTSYPGVLVITGDHDDRAVPMHSYKYVAALQKKSKSDNPVLLLVQKNMGHQDMGIDLDVNIYSFIYDQFGITARKLNTPRY